MAKTTDTIPIWLGSKQNRKQGIVAIPAEATAHKSGLLFLEAVDSGGTIQDGVYLWARSNDTLAYDTSAPSNELSSGTTLGTTTGANKALSNLASVAINTALLDDVKNIDDIGSTLKYWKDLYIGGDIYIQEVLDTSFDYKITFETPSADSVLSVPYPGTAADIMLDTGAATAITYTKSTANITLGAAASLDIGAAGTLDVGTGNMTLAGTASLDMVTGSALDLASSANVDFGASGVYNFVGDIDIDTAATVDINANFSIAASTPFTISGGSAIAIDQDLQASASPTFVAVTTQGITNTTTVIDTTAQLQVGEDNVYLTLGKSNETDSKIYFDGVGNLRFYDSNTSTAYTLQQLASGTTLNPTVTGDLTITDGNFTWDNNTNSETATWTLDATTVDSILLISGATTAAALHITADSAEAGGNLLQLDNVGGFGGAGFYIYTDDDTDTPFTVGDHGALNMVSTSDVKHKISRDNASTDPILEIEELATDGDVALLIDSDHTGASNAMEITYAGTEYGLDITGANVAGSALYVAGPASQTAPLILVDGTTAATGWVGAATVGMIQIENNGDLANADAHVIQLDNTGSAPTGITGASIHVTDASTTGGGIASAVYINSSGALSALHVAAGTVDIDSYMDIDNYVEITNATDSDHTALAVTQLDANNSEDGVTVTFASDGRGLYVTNTKVDGTNAVFATGVASTTDPNVLIDGSTQNWIGAGDTGQLHIKADAAFAQTTGSLLLLDYESGATPKTGAAGSCLRITDQSQNGAGTEYAAYISSTNNEALYIPDGKVAFKENLNITIDASEDCDALTIDQNDSNNNKDGVVINTTGTGYALKVTSDSTTNKGSHFIGKAEQITSIVTINGQDGNGFDGDDGIGMLHLVDDGTLAHAAASLLQIAGAGSTASGATGSALRIIEASTSGGGTSYAAYIDASGTNMEALHTVTGKVVIDEQLTLGADVVITTGATVGTTLGVTGAATFTAGAQSLAVGRTTNASAGSGDSQIAAGTAFVSVSSTGAAHFIVLPAPVAGNVIWLAADATAFELVAHATDCTSININNAKATNGLASTTVTALTLVRCTCADSTHWIASQYSVNGTESALDAAAS